MVEIRSESEMIAERSLLRALQSAIEGDIIHVRDSEEDIPYTVTLPQGVGLVMEDCTLHVDKDAIIDLTAISAAQTANPTWNGRVVGHRTNGWAPAQGNTIALRRRPVGPLKGS